MSDLRDDPTPWHKAGDVVAEVERLRQQVATLDAARADAEILHRGASRQLWEASQEVDRLREELAQVHGWWNADIRRAQELRAAIVLHRERVTLGTSANEQLWAVLEDDHA